MNMSYYKTCKMAPLSHNAFDVNTETECPIETRNKWRKTAKHNISPHIIRQKQK